MKQSPEIKGAMISGHYKRFKKDPIGLLLESSRQSGDLFMLKVLNKPIYFLNSPELVGYVTQSNFENYIKTPTTPLRKVLGEGIFTIDGEKWIERRRLYQPALNNSAVKSYTHSVVQSSSELIAEMLIDQKKGRPFNITKAMTDITINVLGKTLFSTNVQLDGILRKDIGTIVEWIGNRRLRHPFVVPSNWPTPTNKKFDKAVQSLDSLIYRIISEKKKKPLSSNDLLSRFMENDENDVPQLNDSLLRDELVTIFLAGHETSANALNWAFYCLSEHQDIQEKVASEIAHLGDKEFQYEDLHQLSYTVQVLSEVMRKYPPVWHFGRVNLKEDNLAEYNIPEGSSVRISPIIIHRNPKYWETPDKFDPDRFAKGKEIVPNTYMPFGAGPRLCAGRNFAMMEMTLILAEVVRKFKFNCINKDIKMSPLVTLRTSEDVLLNLELR